MDLFVICLHAEENRGFYLMALEKRTATQKVEKHKERTTFAYPTPFPPVPPHFPTPTSYPTQLQLLSLLSDTEEKWASSCKQLQLEAN